jgi:thiamine biosynthesis protein ThiI
MTRFDKLHLLGFSGELSIKGKGTRNRFTRRLAKNLAEALESAGIEHRLEPTWSRLFVRSNSADVGEIARQIFGVHTVAEVEEREWATLEDLLTHGREIFTQRVEGRTFAVRARRGSASQKIPFRSPQLERELGALLAPAAAGVDLRNPEVTVRIELHGSRAMFFSEQEPGPGGLPLGTEGRALALLSGGFDSGVAAWQLLRRGVRLDYLLLNLGGDAHRDAVLRVLEVLGKRWSHGYSPRFHLVDFGEVVEEIQACCPQSLWQVVLKRQMLRTADQLCRMVRGAALVTGEAVGQVSSQTLQNLAVISQATDLPLLRPLIAANKEEIVDLARAIGTYEASAKVPEYCGLAPKNPETHAKPAAVLKAEERLDPRLLRRLLRERAILELRTLDLERIAAPELEIDSIPPGAVVVALRSAMAWKSWHYPGAVRLDFAEALRIHPSFARDKTYVFYCEVGLKSAHLAELVHEAGGRAFHVRRGVRTLRREPRLDTPVLLEKIPESETKD